MINLLGKLINESLTKRGDNFVEFNNISNKDSVFGVQNEGAKLYVELDNTWSIFSKNNDIGKNFNITLTPSDSGEYKLNSIGIVNGSDVKYTFSLWYDGDDRACKAELLVPLSWELDLPIDGSYEIVFSRATN